MKYSELQTAGKDELLAFIDNADRTGYHPVPKDAVQELNNRSNQDLADKTLKTGKIALKVAIWAAIISLISCAATVLQLGGVTFSNISFAQAISVHDKKVDGPKNVERNQIFQSSKLIALTSKGAISGATVSESYKKKDEAEGSEYFTFFGIKFRITDAFMVIFNALLVIFTFFLWRSTEKLWIESKNASLASKKSVEIAKMNLVESRRAFVFAKNIFSFYELDVLTGLYSWRFRPIWENSGETPTKNLRMHTTVVLRNSILPDDFNFDDPNADFGVVLIPPKTTLHGGLGPKFNIPAISPQDILDIEAGVKFLYIWGWVKYSDVFDGYVMHTTRFCWQITPVGDPMNFKPDVIPASVTFSTLHHRYGNEAFDESIN